MVDVACFEVYVLIMSLVSYSSKARMVDNTGPGTWYPVGAFSEARDENRSEDSFGGTTLVLPGVRPGDCEDDVRSSVSSWDQYEEPLDEGQWWCDRMWNIDHELYPADRSQL